MSDYSEYIAQIGLEIEAEEDTTEDIPQFPDPPINFPDMRAKPDKAPPVPVNHGTVHLEGLVDGVRLLESQQVLFYREITSYHKRIEKIVIFFKRVIRKLVRFLLEPMAAEIEQNRQTTVRALRETQQYLTQQEECISFLRNAAAESMDLRQENRMLRDRLDRMEAEMERQKKLLNSLMRAQGGRE